MGRKFEDEVNQEFSQTAVEILSKSWVVNYVILNIFHVLATLAS